MLKRSDGITLISTIITILILLLLATFSINLAIPSTNKFKTQKIISEMKIISTKVESIYENYTFDNSDLIGEKIDINNMKIPHTEIKKIEHKNWYVWDNNILEKLGLDKNILNEDEYFYINYEENQIIYSQGVEYKGNTYYLLNELNNVIQN